MKKSISATVALMGISALGIGVLAAPDAPRVAKPPKSGIPIAIEPIAALQSFADCIEYLDWVKTAAVKQVGPYGLNQWYGRELMYAAEGDVSFDAARTSQTTAPQPGTWSQTNNQVTGVDEPDVVKTDGNYIYTLAQGSLQIVDAVSISLVSSLDLGNYWPTDLLLDGDRALVSIAGYFDAPDTQNERASTRLAYWDGGQYSTMLIEIDLTDRSHPRVTERIKIAGGYVSSRIVDGVARIVVTADPTTNLGFVGPEDVGIEVPIGDLLDATPPTTAPEDPDAALKRAEAQNRVIITNSVAEDWIPTWISVDVDGNELGAAQPLMGCEDASHTAEFSGFSMLTVLTIDLDAGLAAGLGSANAAGVLAEGATVYANSDHLYVAAYDYIESFGTTRIASSGAEGTSIHRFDISDPTDTTYEGSGKIEGSLLNQYAMDEYNNVLRVASTSSQWSNSGGNSSDSAVTTLELRGNELRQLGRVTGLGKGEQIRSVRFINDAGYVVTFMQTDPLYTIDLRNPATPRVVGELKILGYSGYLHPIGDGFLLGIGQDADATGRTKGLQVSMFDVRDSANPVRVAQYTVTDYSSSSVEWDAHGFTWWPTGDTTGIAYVPFESWDEVASHAGVKIIEIDTAATSIDEAGEVSHDQRVSPQYRDFWGYSPVNRTVVIDDALWTRSDFGLLRTDLNGSGSETWIEFPEGDLISYPGGRWIE